MKIRLKYKGDEIIIINLKLKNILKVLIIFMILIIGISSSNACDPICATTYVGGDCDFINDESNSRVEFCEIHLIEDDFNDEDNYEDDLDYEDDDVEDIDFDYEDEDEDDEEIDYYDDEDEYEDELDYEDEDDMDFDWEDEYEDEDYDDEDDDFEYEDISNFDYFKYRIIKYLHKFGNETEGWYESEDFNKTYQSYLVDDSNYSLNEDDESYETYLKIYNSVLSYLEDQDLEENETSYFKFLIIYFLNNYGNVTNYTWDENDSFENFIYDMDLFVATCMPMPDTEKKADVHSDSNKKINNPTSYINYLYSNPIYESNETDEIDNITIGHIEKEEISWLDYIINLLKNIFMNILAFLNENINIGF
jgi:hypothetical protein